MSELKNVVEKASITSQNVGSKYKKLSHRDGKREKKQNQKEENAEVQTTLASSSSNIGNLQRQSVIKKSNNVVRANSDAKSNEISKKSTITNDNKRNAKIDRKLSNLELPKTSKTQSSRSSNKSKVQNSHYFPSKNMYANALKVAKGTNQDQEKNKSSIDSRDTPVTNTRKTDKPTEHNNKDSLTRADTKVERPRTATLRKGSIVNSNIAGPYVPRLEASVTSVNTTSNESELEICEHTNYEDDFESYESDFEDYFSETDLRNLSTGSEESTTDTADLSKQEPNDKTGISSAECEDERKLDSGNFDLHENKHIQLLSSITESKEQERMPSENSRSNMTSLSDEGFEDGKLPLQNGNMQFINFLDAHRKQKSGRRLNRIKKRGEEILGMIHLDHYDFTLLEMEPVPYDIFIKTYGKSNRVQISVQTGEDNISEETQTDTMEYINTWTQFPTKFSKIDTTSSDYLMYYREQYLGVGHESGKPSSVEKLNKYSNNKLKTFILSAGQVIMSLLSQSKINFKQNLKTTSTSMPFSNDIVELNTNTIPFLKFCPATIVNFSYGRPLKFLTVHDTSHYNRNTDSEKVTFETCICVWDANNLELETVLAGYGKISSCCFMMDLSSCIVAGLHDGSLNMWNTKQQSAVDQKYATLKTEYILLTTCYKTEIGIAHASNVIAVHPLTDTSNFHPGNGNNGKLCSLDEEGIVIIWHITVKEQPSNKILANQGMSAWDEMRLLLITKLSLKDGCPDIPELLCTRMNINLNDTSHLFISTRCRNVLHCLTSGNKPNPQRYVLDALSTIHYLECYPFSSEYFLVSHGNGNISLFKRSLERSLITMSISTSNQIDILQWSQNTPWLIYAKDNHNIIHIWNLEVSDIFPIYTIPFKEDIVCMNLSPYYFNAQTSFMLLSTADGAIRLYILNDEHGQRSSEKHEKDKLQFLNYVNRL